jgi:hypothetical protein
VETLRNAIPIHEVLPVLSCAVPHLFAGGSACVQRARTRRCHTTFDRRLHQSNNGSTTTDSVRIALANVESIADPPWSWWPNLLRRPSSSGLPQAVFKRIAAGLNGNSQEIFSRSWTAIVSAPPAPPGAPAPVPAAARDEDSVKPFRCRPEYLNTECQTIQLSEFRSAFSVQRSAEHLNLSAYSFRKKFRCSGHKN